MVAAARFALAVAAFAGAASAQLTITNPNSNSWWVAASQNNLAWTCRTSPFDNFTVSLSNSNPSVLSAPIAITAIQPNFDCSRIITEDQSSQTPATGYRVLLSNPFNSTDVYAQSDEFEIKPRGSAYPQTSSSAPAGTATDSGASASGTAQGSNNGNGASSLKGLSVGVVSAVAAAIAYFM